MLAQQRSRFYTPQFALVPPMDWFGSLTKLVEHLGRDDIRSVDALLAFVSRDYVSSRILYHVLRWLPRATREDGLVYKSAADWQAETGISASQVKARKANGALEELGITWDVMRANKIPHSHYGLDAAAFVKHLARVLGMLVCQVEAICYLRTMPGVGSNQTGVRVEAPHSLTGKHSNTQYGVNGSSSTPGKVSTMDELLVKKLVRAGLSRKDNPERFGVLPMEIIDQCIEDTDAAKKANEIRYTVRAYLRGALENQVRKMQEAPPMAPLAAQGDTTPPSSSPHCVGGELDDVCSKCGEMPHWFTGDCGCRESGLSESSDTPPSNSPHCVGGGQYSATEEERQQWQVTYDQMEYQLNQYSFDTFLRRAKFAGVDDGVFVVLVPDRHAQEMLQYRLYRNIERVLSDCRGEKTAIRFEVK